MKLLIISFLLFPSFCIAQKKTFVETIRIDVYGHVDENEELILTIENLVPEDNKSWKYPLTLKSSSTIVNHGTIFLKLNDSLIDQQPLLISIKEKSYWNPFTEKITMVYQNDQDRVILLRSTGCEKNFFNLYWQNEIPSSIVYWYPYLKSIPEKTSVLESR